MAAAYESLVTEIDRVITSPYPTQLKGLRDIVCTRCARGDIAKWALSRPCQIERLVECLLEGLRQWPYVLELITRLSNETAVRDAMLQQCPTLLHEIIDHAGKASSRDSRYVSAAVTFLSDPLPESIAMPSEAQTLFIRLFDLATDEPSLPNIRKVHKILSGTSSLLLGLLSSSSLLQLEEHLFDIIRNIKGENQSLSLYCLAIMKIMCSDSNDDFRLSNSQYETQELLASTGITSASKWTSDAIQQFFSGSKAQKTVQLVVLRAMWACTTSTGEPFDERMESLLLANEVISAISPHLRETWRKANSLIVGKLQDKIMSTALEPELKFQGLCFLAQVAEGSRVPATVIDGLRGFVMQPSKLQHALSAASSAGTGYMLDAGVFDENTLTASLQQAVDLAANSNQEHWLETSSCLLTVLEQIYVGMASDSRLAEGSMLALDVISCGQKLRKLLNLIENARGRDCDGSSKECGKAVQNARCSLVNSLCKTFLRSALSSPHQSYSASQDTITLLLELYAKSGRSEGQCSHIDRKARIGTTGPSFVGSVGTSEDAQFSWREAVQRHAQDRAQIDTTRLTAVFSKACSNLEARCEDVEMPLRKEKARFEELQRRYNELEQGFASLEAQSAERSVRFNAVEIERDHYIGDLEMQREEIEGNERKIEELLLALQRAREEAEQSRRDARNEAETAELTHAASSARKDEELEELQIRLHEAERQEQEKMTDLDALRAEESQLQLELQQAKDELEEAHRLDAEHQRAITDVRRERDATYSQIEELSSSLDAARDDAMAQREAFERDLSDLRQQADTDFATASDKHEEKIADLTRMYEENAEALRKQLAEVQDEVDQAREQHRADIEQWETEIGEKQKKVDRLSRRCGEKDKQIAAANAMRTNLIAAMELGAVPSHGQILPARTSHSSTTQRARYQEPGTQEDPSPPTPFSGDDSQQVDAADTSFASNATSSGESRNGPTPKRPRPRRSLKTHSPAKPTSRLSVSTRSGARMSLAPQTGKSSGQMRQPLLGVSQNQNRLPVRPSTKTPSKRVQDEEDMFEGSEIFAGTQGMRLTDLGATLDEDTETGL